MEYEKGIHEAIVRSSDQALPTPARPDDAGYGHPTAVAIDHAAKSTRYFKAQRLSRHLDNEELVACAYRRRRVVPAL